MENNMEKNINEFDDMNDMNNYHSPTYNPPAYEEKREDKCLKCMKGNLFLFLLLLGIAVGIAIGVSVKLLHPDFGDPDTLEGKRNEMYLSFPGKLLLRMLKMCIIPLIVSSLIAGMSSIPSKAAGRVGGYAVLYYIITTLMAVLLGILLVATIRPGEKNFDNTENESQDRLVNPVDALLDLVRNAFTNNLVYACVGQHRTTYTTKMVGEVKNNETTGENYTVYTKTIVDFKVEEGGGTNVLGLVVFSVTLGIVINKMGQSGLPLKRFFDSLQEAIIWIVKLIIWYSPIGICFLLAGRIVAMADPAQDFYKLMWYMITVIIGLLLHAFITLPIIYLIFTRKNPFLLMMHMGQALLTALGTASSSATLPITLKCLEENAKVDRRVSRFVLPVGATINMDGTALYEAVASIFIAQVYGYSLDAGQYVTVSLTATAAAIGAAGVPEAGLVTMAIVLTALNLPTEYLGLIIAVDWFLDRIRTTVNVWGDSVGAGVVEVLGKNQLSKLPDLSYNDDDYPEEDERNEAHVNQAYNDTRF